jgi:hypothetical protein
VEIANGKSYYGPFPDHQDIEVELPSTTVTNQIKIVGGRNLRVIGGHIAPEDGVRFCLRIVDITGSAFIEGLLIDAKNLTGDGINVSGKKGFAPEVYLQNVRVLNINGFAAGEHADIFQPQGDIGNLHIDRLTGGSNYQGLFLRPEFQVASAIIKNINLRFLPNVHHPVTYLLWMRDSEDSPKLYPVSLESVYLEPRSGQTVSAHAVFPSARSTKYPAVEVDGRVSWPVGSLISGSVLSGTPPSGDFVPEGSAGTSYVSPGYRQE